MRIALLLSGFLRSFNYQNLYDKLLKKYSIDIYVYISKNEYDIDKYSNTKINIDEVKNILNPLKIIYDDEIYIDTNDKYINTYRQWYKIYTLNEEKKLYEKKNY